MARHLAAMVAVIALVAACGDGDGTGAGPDGPPPPERLAAAVTALAEANTGHFAAETAGSDGVPQSRVEGDFQLLPPVARATVSRYDAGGDRQDTDVLAIGRNAWSRDAGSCWIHHDVTELFANGLLVRNGDTFAPAPVAVAGLGRGVYSTDADQLSGTSELGVVLSVTDLSLPSLLGLTRSAEQRVPITFTLTGDALVGWKVFVRDAVEKAREVAESNASGDGRLSALGSLGGAITTELTALGEKIDTSPPPADEVVEYAADAAELSRRLAACSIQTP